MKKSVKILTILGLSVTLAGVGVIGAAFAMGAEWKWAYQNNWPISPVSRGLTQQQKEGEQIKSFQSIDRLSLSMDAGSVSVKTQNDVEEIQVKTYPSDSHEFEMRAENGELKVEGKVKKWRHLFSFDMLNDDYAYIEVIVPAGHRFQKMELSVDAGDLCLNDIVVGQMDVELNAGDVEIFAQVEDLELDINAGSLLFTGEINRKLDGSIKAGEVILELQGKQKDFNYQIENRAGSIRLGTDRYDGLSVETKVDNQAAKEIDLECLAGSIQVDFKE